MIACGLRILAHLAGPGAFAGRGTCGPRHVMTDDSDAEGAAAREVWPCVQRLLCTFHIGQATWRWLRTPGNGVTEDKRQQRMQELSSLIFSSSVNTLEARFTQYFSVSFSNIMLNCQLVDWTLHQ